MLINLELGQLSLCLYSSRGVFCVSVVVCFVLFHIVLYVCVEAASLGRGACSGGWCWPTAILAAFVHLFLYVIQYDYIHHNSPCRVHIITFRLS